ncbi:MAG TPA: hypothetical protein VKA36_06050 [Solirubrobacterales bacterium]|nr:hypothetical protein [Solirubrobacterales bacterium]
MAVVQALVSDLMLASKVSETLTSAGHDVLSGGLEPSADVDVIVADLDAVDAEKVGAAGPPTLGFYRHTEPEVRAEAEEAGFDRVVPRSRMARELPGLVGALLSS